MLEPLDPVRFDTLGREDDTYVCNPTQRVRQWLRDENLGECVLHLLLVFWDIWFPRKTYPDEDDRSEWYIHIADFPFRRLRIRPVSATAVGIYTFGKLAETFDILGQSPKNLQSMVKWVWDFGKLQDDIHPEGWAEFPLPDTPALRPLDSVRLEALGREDDNGRSIGIRNVEMYSRAGDLPECLLSLLCVFRDVWRPRYHYTREDESDWHQYFRDFPFSRLRIQAVSKTAIGIYRSGKLAKTFEVLNSPQNWQPLVRWIWNYGHKRLIAHLTPRAKQSKSTNRKTPFPAQKLLKSHHQKQTSYHKTLALSPTKPVAPSPLRRELQPANETKVASEILSSATTSDLLRDGADVAGSTGITQRFSAPYHEAEDHENQRGHEGDMDMG